MSEDNLSYDELKERLVDVVMPHINGRQLVNRLQKNHRNIKVLFMSGYIDDATVYRGVIESGTPFIQKPFTTNQIAVKIREVLND